MSSSAVSWLLRTGQAYVEQVCQKVTLTQGVALFSAQFAGLPEGGQFRELYVEDSARLPAALDEVEAFFAERQVPCLLWAPALEQPVKPLHELLPARGFKPRAYWAMMLTRWVKVEKPAELKLVPARAVRAAFRETLAPAADDPRSDDDGGMAKLALAAHEHRLDDPRWDMFVALREGAAMGRCGLLQAGDTARLLELAASERDVQRALIAHCLRLAQRMTLRQICVQVPQDDPAARELYESMGFEADGELVEFAR